MDGMSLSAAIDIGALANPLVGRIYQMVDNAFTWTLPSQKIICLYSSGSYYHFIKIIFRVSIESELTSLMK